nr:alpha/beta fold hydrolase [Candidatus Sigynarchaeota archaeon]
MRVARIVAYIVATTIIVFLANQVNSLLSVLFGIMITILLLEIVLLSVQRSFFRFDDDPGISTISPTKLQIETLSIRNMHARLIKSHHTPPEKAPVVIMHHGYGSTYRRMLVYAYPIALKGYAVLLYNTLGHGKIVKENASRVDERTPGDKTEVVEIMKALSRVVEFIKQRPDLDGGKVGFVGISLGAIVGLTYGCCNPDIKCVIALAGVHDFSKTSTRRLVPFTSDWFMKKSFEWSGLEMEPSKLQDFIVSPAFYLDKQFGFFERPVWTDQKNKDKIFLIHCEDDCTIPFWNFEENVKQLGLPPEHCLALKSGNHWFIRQEHLIIGQILFWLDTKLSGSNEGK